MIHAGSKPGPPCREGNKDKSQQVRLVSVLNLAFQVDPNAGSEIDPEIVQLIENCLNLPAALEREDLKMIKEV